MKQLPQQPESANVRALAQVYRENFSGSSGDTLTLAYTPLLTVDGVGLEQVFVDGLLMVDPDDYTISGTAITLTSALAGTEKVVVYYSYRS